MSENLASKKNIKMTIEYDGTNYHGWQSQQNSVSVCNVLTAAVKNLTDEDIKFSAASRTDKGVHAYGQVVNFFTNSKIPPDKYSHALNSMLPADIVVKESREASLHFHAQYHSKGKRYKYIIYNARTPSALMRDRAAYVHYGQKITKMTQAAEYFLGRHDFSAFCSAGSMAKSFERTIKSLTLEKKGEIIEIDISGDGFLYNMVRIIAGTLVDVGRGAIPVEAIPKIIEGKDRTKAGKTAPAQGLYLMEVLY